MKITVTIHATISNVMYRAVLRLLTNDQLRDRLQAQCPVGVRIDRATIATDETE